MVQQFTQIREDIIKGDIKPFYLLFGKEHFYIDQICNLLLDKVLTQEERDFGQIVYYGADVNAEQVVSTARQYPMMVSRQLVVVKEAQMMKKPENMGVYFDGMMPTTVLVICYKTPNEFSGGKNIDKRTSFYKKAMEKGVVFESVPVPDYKMPLWIENYISSKGFSISPDAAAMMAEYCGTDLAKISLEMEKLAKMLPEGNKNISVRDVEENVGISRDYSVFELTKAISFKDALKCYKITAFFGDAPKRYPIQITIGALSNHFFRILKYHSAVSDKLNRTQTAAKLGINPYFMNEYEAAGKNYPTRKAIKVITLLKNYDLKSKSNSRGAADDGQLLLELVSKILNV